MKQNNLYIILTILFALIAFNSPAQKVDSFSSEKPTVLIVSSLIKHDDDSLKDSSE